MIKILSVIALLAFINGCTFSKPKNIEAEYLFEDDPKNERVVLIFTNKLNKNVCIPRGNWPNHAGNIDGASRRISLVVGDTKYDIEEFDEGFCPLCLLNIAPGERVSAFIKYRSFDLPKEKYNLQKQLTLKLKIIYPCKYKTNW